MEISRRELLKTASVLTGNAVALALPSSAFADTPKRTPRTSARKSMCLLLARVHCSGCDEAAKGTFGRVGGKGVQVKSLYFKSLASKAVTFMSEFVVHSVANQMQRQLMYDQGFAVGESQLERLLEGFDFPIGDGVDQSILILRGRCYDDGSHRVIKFTTRKLTLALLRPAEFFIGGTVRDALDMLWEQRLETEISVNGLCATYERVGKIYKSGDPTIRMDVLMFVEEAAHN
jgi:hypothetical protein